MNSETLIQLLKLTKADGANSRCIVSSNSNGITTRSMTAAADLITSVVCEDTIDITAELGIIDIDKLIKMLQLHNEEVELVYKQNKLHIKDSKVVSEYGIANPAYIKTKSLDLDEVTYDGMITLDKDTLSQFIKSMKVLADAECIGIALSNDESIVVVGDKQQFTNKTHFGVASKVVDDSKVNEIFYLSLQSVKKILDTNSTCENVIMHVALEGLVTFICTYERIVAEYHLIMLED